MVAVGHLVHKYDEIICSIHQGGHPASHHDPPVGGPWWGSFAKTTGVERSVAYVIIWCPSPPCTASTSPLTLLSAYIMRGLLCAAFSIKQYQEHSSALPE